MRADGVKVCVAGMPAYSRVGTLLGALRNAGCEVRFIHADTEDLIDESGNGEWARELLQSDGLLAMEFDRQMDAAIEADVFVLCAPCSRSLHLLAGAAIAAGVHLVVLLAMGPPELSYRQADTLCVNVAEVLDVVFETISERSAGGVGTEVSEESSSCGRGDANTAPAFSDPRVSTALGEALSRQNPGEAVNVGRPA